MPDDIINPDDPQPNQPSVGGEFEPIPVTPDPPVVPGEPSQPIIGTFDPTAGEPLALTFRTETKEASIASASALTPTAPSARSEPRAEYPVQVFELETVKEKEGTDSKISAKTKKFVPQLKPVPQNKVGVGPATPIGGGQYQFTATIGEKFAKSTVLVFLIPVDDKRIGYGSVVVNKGA